MLNTRSPSPTPQAEENYEETHEEREKRRAHLKTIYDWALDRYDDALRPLIKTYKRDRWLSAFATIITPLSLFVTIPYIMACNATKQNKLTFVEMALVVLGGFVPILSGFISRAAAKKKTYMNAPKKPPVKLLRMKGKPEEIKKMLKTHSVEFEKNYADIPLDAFKDLGKGKIKEFQQKILGIPRFEYKEVIDVQTELVSETEVLQKKTVYQVTEEMPEGKLKPSKIIIPVPGIENETDVYLEEEQDKRVKIRTRQKQQHEIIVIDPDDQPGPKITFTPDFRPGVRAGQNALAGTLFFYHSIVRSTQNVDQLEAEYEKYQEAMRLRQ